MSSASLRLRMRPVCLAVDVVLTVALCGRVSLAEEPFQVEVNILTATVKAGSTAIGTVKRGDKLTAHDFNGSAYLVDLPGANPPKQGRIDKNECHRVVDDLAEVKRRIAALPAEHRQQAVDDFNRKRDRLVELEKRYNELDARHQWKESLPVARELADGAAELYGARSTTAANEFTILGNRLADLGDNAAARKYHEQALAIRCEVLGEKHADTATSLNNLGVVAYRMGDYAAARKYHEQALAIKREVLGEKHASTAMSLNNLGVVADGMGDYAAARKYHEQALAIRREMLGEKHASTAKSLDNLGNVAHDMGDYPAARTYLEQALAIRREVLGEKHADTADSLNDLGFVACDTGDYPAARKYYEEALAIYREVLGEKHASTAMSLDNLGTVARYMGDYPAARKYHEQALAIRREVLGEKHPDYALSLVDLSLCELKMHLAGEALRVSRDAAQIARDNLEQTATIQSERQQLAMARVSRLYLDVFLSAYRAANAPAEDAYDQVLAWKGAVTDRQGFLRAMRSDVKDQPETLKLYVEQQDTTRQLGAAVSFVPTDENRESHRKRVDDLSQKVEELQQKLAGASAAFAEQLRHRRRTAAELRQALPEGVALVDLMQYTDYAPSDDYPTKPGAVKPQRFMAFVVQHARPTASVDLGQAEPLSEAVDVWRARQTGRPAEGTAAGKKLDATLAAWKETQEDADPTVKLREWVWDKLPVEVRDPARTATVLISPDGALSRFPWAALPGPKPGTYLLEEQGIAVIPVARALPELLAKTTGDGPLPDPLAKREGERRGPSLLAVGNVNYGGDPGMLLASADGQRGERAVRNGSVTWPALPGTRREIVAILDSFEQRFADGRAKPLRDNQATKQAVEELAPKYRYLHFATHGFFSDPDVRPLTLGNDRPEREGLRGATRLELSGNHPGLLSGIVLTGANRPVAEDKDDGILTALEVGELDLSGVDLVTLSACETGLGATAGGEGLLGLQRAFQTAGARTTIATLWKVNDDAARSLMIEMYENMWGEKKMSKLEALRQAQLSMLREGVKRGLDFKDDQPPNRDHRLPPYYWAAFVLSGDWR